MRFYRVTYGNERRNYGFQWFTVCRDADRAAKQWLDESPDETLARVQIIEIEPTKAGILSALNLYAGHPEAEP